MRQFTRFKAAHPDCLLFFRMGDFYELFGPDAETAHRTLGITLTERSKGMPMAGVPHHAAEGYLRRLVEQGFRVAVCDQVQDPKELKAAMRTFSESSAAFLKTLGCTKRVRAIFSATTGAVESTA